MRTEALITYLYNIVDELVSNDDYLINVDFLDNDINSYSIDKIPTNTTEEKWIIPTTLKQDIYSFRSRFKYTSSQAEQLKNIGFFEKFEEKIEDNNRNNILPEIEGVENIECLNCGSVQFANDNTCEMNIQIKVSYLKDSKKKGISL